LRRPSAVLPRHRQRTSDRGTNPVRPCPDAGRSPGGPTSPVGRLEGAPSTVRRGLLGKAIEAAIRIFSRRLIHHGTKPQHRNTTAGAPGASRGLRLVCPTLTAAEGPDPPLGFLKKTKRPGRRGQGRRGANVGARFCSGANRATLAPPNFAATHWEGRKKIRANWEQPTRRNRSGTTNANRGPQKRAKVQG